MPTVEYPTNPNTDTAFVTDDGGKRTRSLKTVLVDGTIDYPKNANVKDCYVTIDGKKQRALMTADVSKDGVVEYPDGSNSTKGHVTVDGKKHRVVLTAVLAGGAADPVIAELNVTPTTSAQTITAPEGTDGYNPVNVSAVTASIDANIQAGNIKKDVTILGVTGTYAPSAGGKYQMLQRIKDDSNNEIGIVIGFHKDSSNNEYAVVCLDAQYRANSIQILTNTNSYISTLTQYSSQAAYMSTETATENTTKISNYADSTSDSAPGVVHARSKTFTIENQVYAGQIPIFAELMMIYVYGAQINALDPTASSYSSLIIPTNKNISSATTKNGYGYWTVNSDGRISNTTAWSSSAMLCPILELPNA